MTVTEVIVGEIGVVRIEGNLDHRSASRLGGSLRGLVARGVREVVLNLRELRHVDSRGLGELLFCAAHMGRLNARLLVTHAPEFVCEILRGSRFAVQNPGRIALAP